MLLHCVIKKCETFFFSELQCSTVLSWGCFILTWVRVFLGGAQFYRVKETIASVLDLSIIHLWSAEGIQIPTANIWNIVVNILTMFSLNYSI